MPNQIPDSFLDIDEWILSRRRFIKGLAFAGIISQFPILQACEAVGKNSTSNPLNNHQDQTLRLIIEQLFPEDGNGPNTNEINALHFIKWSLIDPQLPKEEKDFLINGIEWIDEESEKMYGKFFYKLIEYQQEMVIEKILRHNWGQHWISAILSLIFEALLSNPLYGGNTNEAGWLWLQHFPGQPQPISDVLLYPKIIKTINQ